MINEADGAETSVDPDPKLWRFLWIQPVPLGCSTNTVPPPFAPLPEVVPYRLPDASMISPPEGWQPPEPLNVWITVNCHPPPDWGESLNTVPQPRPPSVT